MKNNLFKVLLFLTIMTATSCSYPIYSPNVSVRNSGSDIIKVTKFNWNGYRLVEGHYYGDVPGSSFGQDFILRKKSDLYGPIRIEWQNAKKEKIVKEIEFTKEHISNLNQRRLESVNFYLTQDDLFMFVAPHGVLFANEDENFFFKQSAKFQKEYEAAHPDKCFKSYGCNNKAGNKVKK